MQHCIATGWTRVLSLCSHVRRCLGRSVAHMAVWTPSVGEQSGEWRKQELLGKRFAKRSSRPMGPGRRSGPNTTSRSDFPPYEVQRGPMERVWEGSGRGWEDQEGFQECPGSSRSVQERTGAPRCPGASRNVQGRPGAARSGQERPGTSRSVQGRPGAPRNDQEERPGAACSGQERPGPSRSVHERPGASRASRSVQDHPGASRSIRASLRLVCG